MWIISVALIYSCSSIKIASQTPERTIAVIETRAKVAIVDTGLDETKVSKEVICADGQQDMTRLNIKTDQHGHGTNIAGIILSKLDPTLECLLPIRVDQNAYDVILGLYRALKLNASFVNLSMGGRGPSVSEETVIKALLAANVEVILTAGNDVVDLNKTCEYYPACYKIVDPKLWVVGMIGGGTTGGPINVIMPGKNICGLGLCMSGTSQATAGWTAKRLEDTRAGRKK